MCIEGSTHQDDLQVSPDRNTHTHTHMHIHSMQNTADQLMQPFGKEITDNDS